jgi:hypothetical protein
MRELRSEVVGGRRVRLLVDLDGRYTATIEVWAGAWPGKTAASPVSEIVAASCSTI